MADGMRKFDVKELISYSNDLIRVLKNEKDSNCLQLCLEQSKTLISQCDADLDESKVNVEDSQKKLDASKRKLMEVESEVASVAEIASLQKELEEEIQKENLLREDLRVVINEITDLEDEKACLEERWRTLKKLEQDDLKMEMKLSLYASATSIVPDLHDETKISCHIVKKGQNTVDKFEIDAEKLTAFDTCNSIWKMINLK